MTTQKQKIYVYAHWQGLSEPKLMGTLLAQYAKGKKAFSFEYDLMWLEKEKPFVLDPEIHFFKGLQYPDNKELFGVFNDSMPDSWGRVLMKRRANYVAKENNTHPAPLYEIDFLLGVFDESRMGALRFKTEPEGPFLDDQKGMATPPWAMVRELQNAASHFEKDGDTKHLNKWLQILVAPGSSLGGARPKANVIDENQHLWIAKFPSKNDFINKAQWEYLAYLLAKKAGIDMAECKLEKILGNHHTFFTKRFDRNKNERIHFASAMTLTGNNEARLRDNTASYLDIAECIQNYAVNIDENLSQLWRRIVFNIAISNTDDHLRNHGFLLNENGWTLSPAFDLNPSTDKDGLALNIDMHDNALDFELAKSVGKYFRLSKTQMETIINEVSASAREWQTIAKQIGISKSEQNLMSGAFKVDF